MTITIAVLILLLAFLGSIAGAYLAMYLVFSRSQEFDMSTIMTMLTTDGSAT